MNTTFHMVMMTTHSFFFLFFLIYSVDKSNSNIPIRLTPDGNRDRVKGSPRETRRRTVERWMKD